MICLNDEEMHVLWNALAAARLYYQEYGLKQREKELEDVFGLVHFAKEIKIEIKKEGLTESGIERLQGLMKRREEKVKRREKESGQVIQFPTR